MTNGTDSSQRTVRSFVRRTGRITVAQQRALIDLWPRYGVEFSTDVLDLDAVFGRAAQRVLEIGFGNGENLVHAAAEHPDTDHIGIEVHEPGIGHCLIDAHDLDLSNLRVIRHDAIEVLQYQIEDASLARINLYFPDPWPKKRHHKRRIVQASFLQLAARKLAAAGTLQIATDWENYAEHIDEAIAASTDFTLSERREHAGNDQALDRQTTKFERRGLRKGHRIWDWRLTKK
jgi:tRNA (guanine-N7-)-methyltransferase